MIILLHLQREGNKEIMILASLLKLGKKKRKEKKAVPLSALQAE